MSFGSCCLEIKVGKQMANANNNIPYHCLYRSHTKFYYLSLGHFVSVALKIVDRGQRAYSII